MAVLDLAACPICQARYSLARQTTRSEGRSRVSYECLECGSVLLWLGDDLWLEADRWAYQEIGRPEQAHLLQQTMTADELRELAGREPVRSKPRPPIARYGEALPRDWATTAATEEEPIQEPPTGGRSKGAAAPVMPAASAEEPWAEEPAVGQAWPTGDSSAAPDSFPGSGRVGRLPVRQRRSRGSPFLVVSVALTLLCLVCSSAVMIASSVLGGRASQGILPTNPPFSETRAPEALLPTNEPGAADPSPPAPSEIPPPVASEVPSPAPTETSPPVPTEVPAVVFQGVTDYLAGTGSHYLVGEVLNTTGENLRFVEILASFYDANEQLVGTGSTFAELGIVEAGSTAPFKLVTLDPPPSLASYKLRADYLATNQAPLRLEVVSHSANVADDGWYTITGELRNPQEFAVRFPEIVATYYNATHQVVRVEVAFSELDTLQPGQTSPFQVILVDPPADLHHYALQTEAVPE